MISIICPVFNKLDYTKKCIGSLFIAINKCVSGDEIEIIIVDDGSTDGTYEFVTKNYPTVRVLKGDGNLWWSGAMNLGAQDAIKRGSEYIILINNDNIFDDDYLNTLINFTRSHHFQIVGSKVMDMRTKECWSVGGVFNKSNGFLDMYSEPPQKDKEYFQVDWITGMGTIIHRSVFEKIGYWNRSLFPQYFGDSDFILRAKENGIIPYVYIKSIIWNDTTNTGESQHDGSLKKMVNSLFSIKSHYKISTTYQFLRIHGVGWEGIIRHFLSKHGRFIGGFFKHKILGTKKAGKNNG